MEKIALGNTLFGLLSSGSTCSLHFSLGSCCVQSTGTSIVSLVGRNAAAAAALYSGRSNGCRVCLPPSFLELQLILFTFSDKYSPYNCNQPVLFSTMPSCNRQFYFQELLSSLLIGKVWDLYYNFCISAKKLGFLLIFGCFFSTLELEYWPISNFLTTSAAYPGLHTALERAWPAVLFYAVPSWALFFFMLTQTPTVQMRAEGSSKVDMNGARVSSPNSNSFTYSISP